MDRGEQLKRSLAVLQQNVRITLDVIHETSQDPQWVKEATPETARLLLLRHELLHTVEALVNSATSITVEELERLRSAVLSAVDAETTKVPKADCGKMN